MLREAGGEAGGGVSEGVGVDRKREVPANNTDSRGVVGGEVRGVCT